jgi:hypothetical protein
MYTDLHWFWENIEMVRGFAAYAYTKCFQTRIYTDLRWFLQFIALIRVHPVRYVQLISQRVNLWNSWLIICSTTVENVRQIAPVFFKTKPIFRRGRIKVSSVLTKDYEEKVRFAGGPKQSQTKPILGKSQC